MVNLTTYELKLVVRKRGIKNHQNMSREKLLSTLDESERIFKNLSQNGLERIAKMQNLSQNELKQITKMSNSSQNELEKIAKIRHIKNYKNMLKEELLIALLKSEQSPAELRRSKDNNTEIKEIKEKFNALKNSFSKKKNKKKSKKILFWRRDQQVFKRIRKKNSLTKQEKKHYTKKIKKAEEFFKNIKRRFKQIRKASIPL